MIHHDTLTVTIKRYLKQGRLPAYHVGPRSIRIHRDDLTLLFTSTEEANMTPMGHEFLVCIQPRPHKEEIERRKAVAAKILANREGRRIAPLTTAELVRRSGEGETWYG